MTTINIEQLLPWSPPKRVDTRLGPRNLRTARPTEQFWDAWRAGKSVLKEAGVSCGKDRDGQWEATWWLPVGNVEQATAQASRATDSAVEIPKPDGLEYLGYQKAGVMYAIDLFREGNRAVLIADSMGLGKTISAIGIINYCPDIRKVLVICPASLRINWQRELTKWLVRPMTIGITNGGGKEDWQPADISIINYDVVQKHRPAIDRHGPYDLVILDESHKLKNHEAKRTQAVFGKWSKDTAKRVPPINTKRLLALTGTPILNRPIELYTFLAYADPQGLGRSRMGFAKKYCAAKHNGYGWDFNGSSNLPALQQSLRGRFMIRRLKSEVLAELPPKQYQVIELPANGAVKAVANELAAMQAHEERILALQAAVELAKASDNPGEYEQAVRALRRGILASFTEMSAVRHETALAKIPYVVEHLDTALESGGPVLCFAHHHDVIDSIARSFEGRCVTLTGDTPMAARQQAVDDFQAGKFDLFIGNIQAAGVGITLTKSSHVVFAEMDWVPGNMEQAADRAHRIGQTECVLVQYLVLEGSLDATMARSLVEKQRVIRQALDAPPETGTDVLLSREQPTTVDIPLAEVVAQANTMTDEQVLAAHLCMRILAGQCDGALTLDDRGFNKIDTYIGKSLASQPSLTKRQAVLARRLATKYRRQLGQELVEAAGGVWKD